MLWSKLTKIKDPWSSVENAAQKGVPSPSPGSDDIQKIEVEKEKQQ